MFTCHGSSCGLVAASLTEPKASSSSLFFNKHQWASIAPPFTGEESIYGGIVSTVYHQSYLRSAIRQVVQEALAFPWMDWPPRFVPPSNRARLKATDAFRLQRPPRGSYSFASTKSS